MMIRLSGVICGVTSSDSEASLNDTDVAPLELASWYGISVPLRIFAVSLSEVTTLGCETISPLPVFSIAVSSRSSSTLSVMKAMPSPEVLAAVPMSTNGELVLVLPGVPMVDDALAPLLTPDVFQLPLFCTEPPQRTPRLLS